MVRQLRLRDIGGIIVIDFIDMVLESNRELVLRRLTEALGRDRTRHQVAEVTSLGLVQMTRKRMGTGLVEAFSEPCPHCGGRGLVLHDLPVVASPSRTTPAIALRQDRPRSRPGRGPGRRDRGAESGRAAPAGAPIRVDPSRRSRRVPADRVRATAVSRSIGRSVPARGRCRTTGSRDRLDQAAARPESRPPRTPTRTVSRHTNPVPGTESVDRDGPVEADEIVSSADAARAGQPARTLNRSRSRSTATRMPQDVRRTRRGRDADEH